MKGLICCFLSEKFFDSIENSIFFILIMLMILFLFFLIIGYCVYFVCFIVFCRFGMEFLLSDKLIILFCGIMIFFVICLLKVKILFMYFNLFFLILLFL